MMEKYISLPFVIMKPTWICILFLTAIYSCNTKVSEDLLYLSEIPPTDIPKVFAPGFISYDSISEFGSVFSKDGTEFYYGVDLWGRTEIRFTQLVNGEWSQPTTIISHPEYGYNDPFLSPDEQELYYISDMPLNREGEKKDHDIWYSKREESGWSDPINAGPVINTSSNEYYISFTEKGTMYFSSNRDAADGQPFDFDIYAARREDGKFVEAIKLGPNVNTKNYEADVFVAPDESYLIFCAVRNDGLGQGDLYISFTDDSGNWTKSRNMGDLINSELHELCPFVTYDGKYLLYTSKKDIYWVSSAILNTYRYD